MKLFSDPWPTYVTSQNRLNNFDRGQLMDHSCVFWSKSNGRFQRDDKVKLMTCDDKHTMTDKRQRPVTTAQPVHFVLRWPNKKIFYSRKYILLFIIVFIEFWLFLHLVNKDCSSYFVWYKIFNVKTNTTTNIHFLKQQFINN